MADEEHNGELPDAADTIVELDDLLMAPGTYFNPQTEVLVVVDDSPELDAEIFNMEAYEGADWVLISDEVPVDENRRDELLEEFQSTYHGGDGRQAMSDDDEDLDLDDEDEEDELEPDEDFDEE